ncbi:MAG: hypothetical protein V1850_04130 [Candidatus Bathyarchaeota archaeon]
MEKYSSCFPACESFKCGQLSLSSMDQRIYCRWADDDCVGPTCNYATCIRGRLLSNGVCGLSVKRKTNEEAGPEAIEVDNIISNIRLKGKLSRRFREDEII